MLFLSTIQLDLFWLAFDLSQPFTRRWVYWLLQGLLPATRVGVIRSTTWQYSTRHTSHKKVWWHTTHLSQMRQARPMLAFFSALSGAMSTEGSSHASSVISRSLTFSIDTVTFRYVILLTPWPFVLAFLCFLCHFFFPVIILWSIPSSFSLQTSKECSLFFFLMNLIRLLFLQSL